ncbi:inositol 2-dehydrogenase [Jannaschia marina]|uniref:inositol 2-dehydrogenase n=1 Tax=Jannaschia marina TaxID=2741674 RepID=UPI0015CDE36E|nr:inositol 2-dehydrogenase [Jannaschia marina]
MAVRFAVLGAGRIGQVHADAIARVPGAALVAVTDAMPTAAEAVAARHGCAVRNMEGIAASGDVDAVVVCTPTDTHADLIERFTGAGKAVFCEKPIDLDLGRVKTCLRAVATNGGRLMVGFQRRFDPDFRALKGVIDAGGIGAVETVTLTSRDPGPPPVEYIERSGGIFRDMTIHDFDVARWLLPEEPTHVFAAASNLVDPAIGAAGDWDTANVVLTTPGGAQATIANSRRATYGYDQRIEVHGAGGSVRADNHHTTRVEVANAGGYTRAPLQDFFMSRYAAAYAAEIAAFVAALEAGGEMPTTGEDGLRALALAEAAVLSVREGRSVAISEVM